jgi:hypothetical protein
MDGGHGPGVGWLPPAGHLGGGRAPHPWPAASGCGICVSDGGQRLYSLSSIEVF